MELSYTKPSNGLIKDTLLSIFLHAKLVQYFMLALFSMQIKELENSWSYFVKKNISKGLFLLF
jgi:hypothetical protein